MLCISKTFIIDLIYNVYTEYCKLSTDNVQSDINILVTLKSKLLVYIIERKYYWIKAKTNAL